MRDGLHFFKAREMMKSTRVGAGRAPRGEFKKHITVAAIALLVLLAATSALSDAGKVQVISTASALAGDGQNSVALFDGKQSNVALFDADWRFHQGGAQGAESPDFDDSGWRKLDL